MQHREAFTFGFRKSYTFHGLRHTYAAEMYKSFIQDGKDEHTAKLEVSRLLGHEREDVTNIYLASVKSGEE